jgi:hypothetical protein
MNLPLKQTGLAPLSRAFAFCLFSWVDLCFWFSSWHSRLDKYCPGEKIIRDYLRRKCRKSYRQMANMGPASMRPSIND